MSRARLVSLFVQSLAITSFLIFTAPTISAQGIPWYTIPLPIPNGFVDASTGNLHLEIPLGPHEPARNGDPIVNKIVYDSNTYFWNAMNGNSHSGTAGMVSQSGPCTDSGYPNGSVTTYSGFFFTDNHFTQHAVQNSNIYTKQVSCYTNQPGNLPDPANPGYPSTASGVAADGSGYTFQVTNFTQMTVYSPDGWVVYDSAKGLPFPMDLNGNYNSQPNTSVSTTFTKPPYCPSPPPPPTPASATSTTSYTTSSGAQVSYTITCTTLHTAYTIGSGQFTSTIFVPTSISLEDGTQYVFTYDTGTTGNHQGRLSGVTLPTGGTLAFTYVITDIPIGFATQSVATATFSGGTWNLGYVWNSSTGQITTTVMSPLRYDSASKSNISDKTVFTSIPNNTVNLSGQYYAGTSTLLKTISNSYTPGYLLPSSITTTLNDTGQSSTVSYPSYYNNLRNYPTEKQETDFTGAVARTTVFVYGGPGLKPTSINVYPGSTTSGSPISSTLYTYDEYSANYCKNSVPMLTVVNGAYGHDDTYGNAGNPTTTQRLISGTTYATSHACYDTLGNVTQTVDANGNPTSYIYTDNWVDSYCIPSGTVVHGFPTTITDALGHQSKYSYLTCGVLKQSEADQNQINAGKSTSYTYDILNRPLTISHPDGGLTTSCYSHDPSSSCYTTALPPFSITSRLMSGSNYFTTKTLLDSYGRTAETQITSDPECTSGDKTDTTYDSFSRVVTVSNPYCTTSDLTYGLTTYAYDAIGRATQIANPDGTAETSSYSGNCTTAADEAGKTRKSCSDALGRLTQVFEDPGSSPHLNYETDYGYDALDNLLCVAENNAGAFSGCTSLNTSWRPRTLAYDSLSRLTGATNPESGTTTYSYDGNGNPLTKKDARNITTTYTYDALNRLTLKSYSDGTLEAAYTYDQCSSPCPPAPTANGLGRLVHISNGINAGSTYSYDLMGRIVQKQGCMPLNCSQTAYPVIVTYDLAGDLLTESNGAGVTFSYTYDGAARPILLTSSLVDSYHPATLATTDPSIGYFPNGALRKMTYGNGLTESSVLNNRLQPCRYNVNWSSTALTTCTTSIPSNNLQDFNYGFNAGTTDNGSLASMTGAGGQPFNRTYTYDSVNRLLTLASPSDPNGCDGLSWNYDAWGNRTAQTTTSGSCFQQPSTTFTTSNQFPTTYQYDAAGNMTYDGAHHYTYDAENRITQVDAGATAAYVYGADGKRVQKTTGGVSIDYVYDLSDNVIAEMNSSGWLKGYAYFAGQAIAEYFDNTTYFVHHDHLGSTRLLSIYPAPSNPTNLNQWLVQNLDYLPFGELNSSDSGIDTHKFTGKERDQESGLDNSGARYYASSMGRFISPDPENAGASADAPQSWNGYTYVLNNPISATDPDGLDCLYIQDNGDWNITRGDCDSKTDNGIFVDGRINGGSVSVTKDSDGYVTAVGFLYTPTGTNTLLLHLESDPPTIRESSFLRGAGQMFGGIVKGMNLFHDPTSSQERYSQKQALLLGSFVGPEEEEGSLAGLTRWGWKGGAKWRAALQVLTKPGTHELLAGIVPTVEEATEMIEQTGGTIDRIEQHVPGGVSPHTYPHINYTTAEGEKAAVKVVALPF
jgi:RHS repeat-associated protein